MFGFVDMANIPVRHGCRCGQRPQYNRSTHTANVQVSYRRNMASMPVSYRRGYGQCQHSVKGTNMVNVPVCYGHMKSKDTADV